MEEIFIPDLNQIRQQAREFISHIGQRRVFAFYGAMGAGKTTFIKAVCEELGVGDVITSPTFAIVNEYSLPPAPSCRGGASAAEEASPTEGGLEGADALQGPVYHFDFYRIKRLEEVYDMGYEEYFYSGALCFIEWPELIEDILPEDAVRVMIRH
jgi:tRNA threonylcarbamoyladenosine biosynthesis protein TsaE